MVGNFSQGERVDFRTDSKIIFSFIDKYYNINTENGKIVKKFFKELCKNVFQKNLDIHMRSRLTFPILYGERTCYSTIGASLHDMGYAHMSEWGIGFRDEGGNDGESIYRRVDFWCEKNNRQFWLEFKHFNFYIGHGAKRIHSDDIFFRVKDKITGALKQIQQIKLCEKGYKLAIFNSYLWFHENQEPNEDMKKILERILDSFVEIKEIRKEKVLCGVMDFTQCYKKYNFFLNNDKVAYVMMIGVVYL